MYTDKDSILKPTLWFLHTLAKACEDEIFTLLYLEEQLIDLIIPIATSSVEIVLHFSYFLSQFPLDYINGSLQPQIKDMKYLPSCFAGPRGTHLLAAKTVELLQKFCKSKDTKLYNA